MSDKTHKSAEIATEVRRLANLRPIERDPALETAAKELGCTVRTLRKQVEAYVKKCESEKAPQDNKDNSIFSEPEPWPERITAPAKLLDDVADCIRTYVVTSQEAADAAALWLMHTHCFHAFTYTPRFNIRAPLHGCGKSTFLNVLESMAAKPQKADNLTTAVLFRLIDAYAPTVLIDEYDSFLEQDPQLRGILNAGVQPGAIVWRIEGENNDLRRFKAHAPIALAGIRGLPITLHDRSIVVTMQRALPHDVRASFDSTTRERPTELRRMLARWAADHFDDLKARRPALPPGAVNRMADKWRPLCAIAELAGGDWPARTHKAFQVLQAEELDREDLGTLLLGDLREVFAQHGNPRGLHSSDIVQALILRDDRPWPAIQHGRALTENRLAWMLKPFKVKPVLLRLGGSPQRGYLFSDLAPLFARYLEPMEQGT
jgi:putative DNA primase/helicase